MMHATHLKASLATDSREHAMAEAGIARYRSRQDRLSPAGTVSERDDYSSVIRRSLLGVSERIERLIVDNAGKKPNKCLLKVAAIPAVTLAYIALSATFGALTKKNDKAAIAARIGQSIEDEHNFSTIQRQQPKLWERLKTHADEHGSYRVKRNFALNTAQRDEAPRPAETFVGPMPGLVKIDTWDIGDKCLLGAIFLSLLEVAELVVVVNDTEGNHTTSRVTLHESVIGWLDEHRRKADAGELPMIAPIYAPMTEPPVDWRKPFGGGYRTLKYPLIKRSGATPVTDYRAADLSKVYQAVNLMQRTAWRINPVMLALVDALWTAGGGIGKLPRCERSIVPPRLSQEDWDALTPEQRKGRRLSLKELHAANREAESALVSVNQVLSQAVELKDAPAIYLPYQLDYRGRVYAMPLLNPQGPDYIRCLFEFAEGKPVGERGAMWLAIQVGSLWDGEYNGKRLSKCSFQERYEWTEANEEMLRSVARDPFNDTRWTDADKPFMFLRTARDWMGYLEHGASFVSHLPIDLDGSCSGIQHYSALLRDAEGGAAVNLTPCEYPADVYSEIAAAVCEEVGADEPSEFRDFWLAFGITRKVVKKPVMTYGYSSREAGFTEWYDAEFARPALKKAGRQDMSIAAARYLAKKTMTAVEKRLVAVARGMKWMIECAALLAHEGKGISWTSPSGLPITQKNLEGSFVRVETLLQGERIRIAVPGKSEKINKDKQKNAISPNHTHSLDAAHLVFTVIKGGDTYGLRNFALIHDSFGTLAADTDAMFSAVREAFVEMYEAHDPFQHLYERVQADLSEAGRAKLSPPPSRGDLDLAAVHQSLYAFA